MEISKVHEAINYQEQNLPAKDTPRLLQKATDIYTCKTDSALYHHTLLIYLIVTNLLVPCLAQWLLKSIGLEKL